MFVLFFFFKQKTAYEMRISDWSSDVCSSDLLASGQPLEPCAQPRVDGQPVERDIMDVEQEILGVHAVVAHQPRHRRAMSVKILLLHPPRVGRVDIQQAHDEGAHALVDQVEQLRRRCIERSEEHTSELQSLMRISYAVF